VSRVAHLKAQEQRRDASVSTARRWLPALKLAIGLALVVGLLVWRDNGRQLLHILAGFQTHYLVALLLIALALDAISSVRWRLFVRDRDVAVSLLMLFKFYLMGRFFSIFLPSMIGGDLARIYLLGRWVGSHSLSAASVGLERASGIIALTSLALIFVVFESGLLRDPIVALTLGGAVGASVVMIIAFCWPGLAAGLIVLLRAVPGLGRVAVKFSSLLEEVAYYRTRHGVLLLSLVYSFAFHLLAGINVYVACLTVGLAPPLFSVMVITPVILLVTMIPISPNNIGWWEWCFSILLLGAGATAAEGLAVAITLRSVAMLDSLIGGLLFLLHRDARR
jgi:uncharacterized protein (TIRG00374 family)